MTRPENRHYHQTTLTHIAEKARALRRARGWTLADVETHSRGSISAVSMGAYERGTRSLSLEKSIEIAELYGVPLASFFENSSEREMENSDPSDGRWVIDLRALARAEVSRTSTCINGFISHIIRLRRDWNGEIISLRNQDIVLIAILAECGVEVIRKWLLINAVFHAPK